MICKIHLNVCWQRPRLILFWLVWLAVMLQVLPPLECFIAIGLSFLLRPSDGDPFNEKKLLPAAVGLLIVLPLTALLLGSPAALAFLKTPAGAAVVIAVWACCVLGDLRFYRKLPLFLPRNRRSIPPTD